MKRAHMFSLKRYQAAAKEVKQGQMKKATETMSEAELDERHARKMAKKKQARDKIIAKKTIEKGLVMVHTGKGKGKSTAAFGLVMRALGHGKHVGIVQFVKGKWETGERVVLEKFADQVKIRTMGEGFTWETQDRQRDLAAAKAAWAAAKELILDPSLDLVILDEINIVLRYDYLDSEEVVTFLQTEKPEMTHVVLTGRNAKENIMDIADLVTEMTEIKHPFKAGVKAQIGIEF